MTKTFNLFSSLEPEVGKLQKIEQPDLLLQQPPHTDDF